MRGAQLQSFIDALWKPPQKGVVILGEPVRRHPERRCCSHTSFVYLAKKQRGGGKKIKTVKKRKKLKREKLKKEKNFKRKK